MAALRIGIDARPLHWPGIGRCIRQLVGHLGEIDAQNHYILYVSPDESRAPSFEVGPNFRRIPITPGVHTIAEQFVLPLRIHADRLDIFHAPSSLVVPVLATVPLVVTVHDLLLKLRPDYLPSSLARVYYAVSNRLALQRARTLVAVSDFTRAEIARMYPGFVSKALTVHNGVSPLFHSDDAHGDVQWPLLHELGIKDRFVLYVGTLKMQKNVPALVRAFAMLRDEGHADMQLVLVARPDPRYPDVSRLIDAHGLGDSVVFVDSVADSTLAALYRAADVLAMPSTYEGFGLPVVEAMACATAVAVADIPVFHEVAGEAGVYFDPGDPRSIASVLERVIERADHRVALGQCGRKRAARFTWRRAAEQMRGVYEDTAQRGRQSSSGRI